MKRWYARVLPGGVAAIVSVGTVLAVGLVVVSGPSPYAGCSNAGEPGSVTVNGEVEPSVAVNPATVGTANVNIIGAWQQDRWANGGAHGIAVGSSLDGGTTWAETTLPFSVCAPNAILDPFTGAPYLRASDPWVSIGPDGTAYAVGLLATNSTGAGNNDTGIATVTSSDGGRSWGNARLLKSDQGTSPIFEATQFFNDKESITADPTHPGRAYVVWDRLQGPSQSPDAVLVSRAFRGPTWFSMTSDGGKTWSTARPIFDPGQNSQTIGNVIVVDPTTGRLYDFFADFQTTGSPKFIPRGLSVGFVTSDDGGLTWSGPATVSGEQVANDVDPVTGQQLRTAEELPSVAIDPRVGSGGNLYVVWEDSRFSGGAINQVVISTSTNHGATWTQPALVSTTTGRPAFTPTVAVNSAGTVGVTYYDLRNLLAGNTSTLPTDLWLKTSPAGGASFGADTHVAGSFNLLAAPFAGGFFVGDYQAIGVNGTSFVPFFVQTNCSTGLCPSNPTDVYTGSF
ncbi:MAG TPA: sialidase family protein [Chloroflexota bacterium]